MSSLIFIKFLLLILLAKATSLDDNNTLFACSTNQIKSHDADKAQIETILETLILQLRAKMKFKTHRGYTSGEIQYGNGTKVSAFLLCVKNLSIEECQECARIGITKLYENCVGKDGGIAFTKNCTMRYDNCKLVSSIVDSSGNSVTGNETKYVKKWIDNTAGDRGFKLKVALAWVIGTICLGMFTVGAWALRRSIVNTSRIDPCRGLYDDEKGNGGRV